MKIKKKLELHAYRFLSKNKKLDSLMQKIVPVTVKNLPKTGKPKNFPFLVAITIDTESGYVEKNERRVWQRENPKAFIGFYKGIENWRSLLNKYDAKSTFFCSSQCFDSNGNERKKILKQLSLLLNKKHEIGLHIHPKGDLALQKETNEEYDFTSARFFDFKAKKKFLVASKNLFVKNISRLRTLKSFRWGNWGLDNDSVKILEELGFIVDSSATPGIIGHLSDDMHFDWEQVETHYPFFLSKKNYQDTETQDSKVLEIPIATYNCLGKTLRADPVNLSSLMSAFNYYYKNADRNHKPFVFVIISHSPEGTYEDGKPTKVLSTMEDFLIHSKGFKDVKFVTMKDAYDFLTATK